MRLPALGPIYRRLAPQSVRKRIATLRQRARHVGAGGDHRFRRSLGRLAALRDAHAGERCVVIGNGPSMRGFALERLAGLRTFCLNRGYLMWQDQGLSPDFVVAVNRLVIEQFGGELAGAGGTLFAPWLLAHHFPPQADVIYFEERWDDAFIRDARRGLSSMATVTNTAIQLAWHMGFADVVLIGIDHHFSASAGGRPHQTVVQDTDDADHFRPDYFAPGTRWHLPDLIQSERGYRLARAVFEADGRRIVNATPGTRLEVFEKACLADILAAPAGSR